MQRFVLAPTIVLLLAGCAGSEPVALLSSPSPNARFEQNLTGNVTAAAANGHVLPAAFANTMGDINNSWPHANANMRYQQVFLGSELGSTNGIVGLCLRNDQLALNREVAEHLTVKLGPTQMDNTNLSMTFDANYSDEPTQVFSGDVIIPATTTAGTVDSFDFCISFTTPYALPDGSNLIVEIVNSSSSSRSHAKDACSAAMSGCTTRRVVALSATATTATIADNSGLIMSFLSADPTVRVDCTEDHWAEFGFRNQGQCVRYVETGKDSRQ